MNTQVITENDKEAMLTHAISEVRKLKSGTVFIIQDLFVKDEWFEMAGHLRAGIGRRFYYRYAKKDGAYHMKILDKTKLGQRKYLKI
ncbi:MAG: single-stranded DNA-binding protein [Oscillospiraceae bacterium]|nr:single-stranded DNA-binding protein [Oscillospiraceae bacterium]